MRITFNSIEEENKGFELLAESNMRFTYIGNRQIIINGEQYKILTLNNVKFREMRKEKI